MTESYQRPYYAPNHCQLDIIFFKTPYIIEVYRGMHYIRVLVCVCQREGVCVLDDSYLTTLSIFCPYLFVWKEILGLLVICEAYIEKIKSWWGGALLKVHTYLPLHTLLPVFAPRYFSLHFASCFLHTYFFSLNCTLPGEQSPRP